MKRKGAGKKSGSALVVAIVIMLLVMMLSFALLLACFSLRQSAVRQRTLEQCKEIAQGVSKELTAEITRDFKTPEEVETSLTNDKFPLWNYLRCNLWQTTWPYYNEDEARHQKKAAYKYFTLDYGADGVPGDVTVAMYWESARGESKDGETVTPFFMEVTCQIGEQKSVITSEYELMIDNFSSVSNPEGEADYKPGNPECNPHQNTIQKNEKWTFSFVERE